jgi:hypothetical protein
MITTKQKVVGAGVAVAALVSGSTAAVWAATTSSTPTAAPAATTATTTSPSSTSSTAIPKRRLKVLERTIHGEFEIKDKAGQIVTLDADTGTLTAANATSVTVARADGKSVTIDVSSTTRYGKGKTESDLQTGKDVLVVSRAGTAVAVLQQKA